MSYETHLFICTRCKTQDGSEGVGKELQKNLKSYFKEKFPDQSIRVNKSGCLGKCKLGVNAVCYPKGVWFEKLNEQSSIKDFEEVISNFK